MQTVIKDLPLNEEMDSNDMAAVSGGSLPLQIEQIIQDVSWYVHTGPGVEGGSPSFMERQKK
jgi:hypothetical protein